MGAGLDRLPQVGSRSSLSTADSLQAPGPPERETRTLVVKNVSSDVDDSDVKQLFEVRPNTPRGADTQAAVCRHACCCYLAMLQCIGMFLGMRSLCKY